ncbi:universal stress protein [Kribbella sp. NPDC003557]|uniref:universal stress protein n=1 Tax=Kribbella sp. NPDC003557 TaxID=3154449 RepID=UPI0033BD41D8
MNAGKVVVGIDGRPDSENAIRWAAAEAAARGVPLHLVHAFVWSEFRGVPLGASDMAPGLRAQADLIVADAVELARKCEPGVPVTGERVDGFPAAVLRVASRHADVVVIGSRVTGRLLRLIVSSPGAELAVHAHCPVVVVRPTEDALAGSRVVIGYDGSRPADVAVDFGLEYARRRGLPARIVAVRANDKDDDHALLAGVRRHALAADTELVEVTGHPSELLLEWSADAELLVVGSRGRGGFARMVLGSVSQTMLHQSPCPVAVIPQAAIEGPV